VNEPVLQVDSLTKNFGGLVAVNNVSLELGMGELHAVIGPNGAGKTTLINLLSGELPATAGRILFQGNDVSSLRPEVRSRLGVGRTYQKTNIFPEFSALENCRLAAQSREQRPFNWLRDALSYDTAVDRARRMLDLIGLLERARDPALVLSHGEQRQLEIAMCLATEPCLLLLDEPLAGMGTEESLRMVELIRRLGQTHAILLVEHDMDAVFQLAKVLTVMLDGKILTTGTPDEVRANRQVQAAYLGNAEG
jgi:branched-chain amino acid transport system ATP-binding protein